MKKYRFKNATIYVHGEINKDRLEKATIQFIKNSHKYKISREEVRNK